MVSAKLGALEGYLEVTAPGRVSLVIAAGESRWRSIPLSGGALREVRAAFVRDLDPQRSPEAAGYFAHTPDFERSLRAIDEAISQAHD